MKTLPASWTLAILAFCLVVVALTSVGVAAEESSGDDGSVGANSTTKAPVVANNDGATKKEESTSNETEAPPAKSKESSEAKDSGETPAPSPTKNDSESAAVAGAVESKNGTSSANGTDVEPTKAATNATDEPEKKSKKTSDINETSAEVKKKLNESTTEKPTAQPPVAKAATSDSPGPFTFVAFSDAILPESMVGEEGDEATKDKDVNAVHTIITTFASKDADEDKKVDAVINVGDLAQTSDRMKKMQSVLNQSTQPVLNVLGNRDASLLSEEEKKLLPEVLNLRSTSATNEPITNTSNIDLASQTRYYSRVLGGNSKFSGYRFIVLDGLDESFIMANNTTTNNHFVEYLRKRVPDTETMDTPALKQNGAVSSAQLQWLVQELSAVRQEGQRAVILVHFPVFPAIPYKNTFGHNLWNDQAVNSILANFSSEIAIVISGHSDLGPLNSFRTQVKTCVHYVALTGLHENVNRSSFAVFSLESNGDVKVKGYGNQRRSTRSKGCVKERAERERRLQSATSSSSGSGSSTVPVKAEKYEDKEATKKPVKSENDEVPAPTKAPVTKAKEPSSENDEVPAPTKAPVTKAKEPSSENDEVPTPTRASRKRDEVAEDANVAITKKPTTKPKRYTDADDSWNPSKTKIDETESPMKAHEEDRSNALANPEENTNSTIFYFELVIIVIMVIGFSTLFVKAADAVGVTRNTFTNRCDNDGSGGARAWVLFVQIAASAFALMAWIGTTIWELGWAAINKKKSSGAASDATQTSPTTVVNIGSAGDTGGKKTTGMSLSTATTVAPVAATGPTGKLPSVGSRSEPVPTATAPAAAAGGWDATWSDDDDDGGWDKGDGWGDDSDLDAGTEMEQQRAPLTAPSKPTKIAPPAAAAPTTSVGRPGMKLGAGTTAVKAPMKMKGKKLKE